MRTVSGRKNIARAVKATGETEGMNPGTSGKGAREKGCRLRELLIDDLWRDLKEFMEHCL